MGIGSLECSGLKIQGRAPYLHLLRKKSTYYIPQNCHKYPKWWFGKGGLLEDVAIFGIYVIFVGV